MSGGQGGEHRSGGDLGDVDRRMEAPSAGQPAGGGALSRLSARWRRRAPADAASVAPAGDPDADPWEEFRHELNRSRRYERSFVMIRIPCRTWGANPTSQGRKLTCYDELRRIAGFLRSVDRAWVADGSVYVLLPESDAQMGEAFLGRVRRLAPEILPEEGVRVAAFPKDGATSGALLAKLHGQPVPGTPRDVATVRAPQFPELDLRPQRSPGESPT